MKSEKTNKKDIFNLKTKIPAFYLVIAVFISALASGLLMRIYYNSLLAKNYEIFVNEYTKLDEKLNNCKQLLENNGTIQMVCAVFDDRSLSCSPIINIHGIRWFYKPHGITDPNQLYVCDFDMISYNITNCELLNQTRR